MNFRFKENVNFGKLLVFLTSMELLLAFGAVLLGELVLPFASAFYAIIVIAESKRKRVITYVIPAFYLVFTVLLFILKVYTLALPFSVVIGLLIALLFMKGVSKGELAFYVSAFYLVAVILFIWLRIANSIGTFAFDSMKEFIVNLYKEMQYQFVESMDSYFNAGATTTAIATISRDELESMFNSFIHIIPAMLIIISFFLAGITFKFFSHLLYTYAKDEKQIALWRFSLPNIVAYFYVAVFVLSIFVSSTDSVFAMSIMNFYYVFLFVFAYIGFNFVLAALSQTRRRGGVIIAIFAAIILLGVIALEILSLCGVFFTYVVNKMGPDAVGGDKGTYQK